MAWPIPFRTDIKTFAATATALHVYFVYLYILMDRVLATRRRSKTVLIRFVIFLFQLVYFGVLETKRGIPGATGSSGISLLLSFFSVEFVIHRNSFSPFCITIHVSIPHVYP